MKHNSRGFTLIELLTVILIIGILAVIALPKFVRTREKAYVAVMESDLRNLATAQETYFVRSSSYTVVLGNLRYYGSERVTVDIPEANVIGWRATASHASALGRACEIYYGTASGASTATLEGAVECN